jgi:hypothetical protein
MTSHSIPVIYPRIVDSRDFDEAADGQGPAIINLVNPSALIPTALAIAAVGATVSITNFRALSNMTKAGYLAIRLRGTDANGATGTFDNLIPLLNNV